MSTSRTMPPPSAAAHGEDEDPEEVEALLDGDESSGQREDEDADEVEGELGGRE